MPSNRICKILTLQEFINPDKLGEVKNLSDEEYLELYSQVVMCGETGYRIQRLLKKVRKLEALHSQ